LFSVAGRGPAGSPEGINALSGVSCVVPGSPGSRTPGVPFLSPGILNVSGPDMLTALPATGSQVRGAGDAVRLPLILRSLFVHF